MKYLMTHKRLFVVFVLLWGVLFTTAQETFSPSPEMATQMSELIRFTEALRQLPTLNAVEVRFPTRPELRAYLDEQLAEALTEEAVQEAMQFYIAFGFLPADYALKDEYIAFYGSQVGGFYDTQDLSMNVVLLQESATPPNLLPILERITFVHEYTHALQDQHFDLDAYIEASTALNNPDVSLARLALVEGDATFTMQGYVLAESQRNPLGTLTAVLLQGFTTNTLTLPEGIPSILSNELLFPYEQGLTFAEALFRESSDWTLINQAFSNLPASTEQILHPQKYLAGEAPIAITQPDSSASLGENWQLLRESTFGEFYLRQWLGKQFGTLDINRAASGWGGDSFQIYADEAGQWALRYHIVMDTPQDLDELASLLTQYTREDAVVSVRKTATALIVCISPDSRLVDTLLATHLDR